MPNSICEAIAAHAQENPERLCLADNKNALTYSQVWNAIRAYAEILLKAGVETGDCVLIECTQDVRYSIAIQAVQLLGGVFVPLEKRTNPQRVAEIREETNSKICIGKTVAWEDGLFLSIDAISLNSMPNGNNFSFPESGQTAEILFSTGTTGKSKGIEHTHGSVVAVAENVISGVKMKDGGVELIPTPLSHSHGLRRHYANLLFGNSVVLTDGVFMVKVFFDLMDRYHVTGLDMSPSALQVLDKLSKDKLGEYKEQLDYVQIGTAPLSEKQKTRLCELLPHTHLYNFYGTTEGGCSCIMDFSVNRGKPACIGKPTVNASFMIVDEHRQPIQSSAENTGYLAYSGSMNMKGYWHQPDLTASVMTDGVIYSNDVGYIDEEGYVYMLGRDDDVINYSGIKISPEEIESAVLAIPEIADCACVPQPDPMTGQTPKLFVVMESGRELDRGALLAKLQGSIDANKMPKTIVQIDEIPRTFNGKILRRELRKLA